MKVQVIMLGGLELLARGQQSQFMLDVAPGSSVQTIPELVADQIIERNAELFIEPESKQLCEGIVFLINDGELEFLDRDVVADGDKITFISMIHGG